MPWLLAVIFVCAVVWFLFLALAAAGQAAVIGLDYLASSFTLLGVQDPILAWFLLGALPGAAWGAVQGFRRGGRASAVRYVYGGAGAGAVVLLMAAAQGHPHRATASSTGSGPGGVASSASPAGPAPNFGSMQVAGTWRGAFSGHPALLVVTRQDASTFEGVLASRGARQVSRVSIKGRLVNAATREIQLHEDALLPNSAGRTWSLGNDFGTISADGAAMAGNGKDARGNSYLWVFSREGAGTQLGEPAPWPRRPASLAGVWRGRQGTAEITLTGVRQSGGRFNGVFEARSPAWSVKIAIVGERMDPCGIAWHETDMLQATGSRWTRGRCQGYLSADGRRLLGWGRDPVNGSYSWSLAR